jgi:hypothetical protein
MTLDEMKDKAKALVEANNPDKTNFHVSKVYENVMDGTLMTISFSDAGNSSDHNHILFTDDGLTRSYRWHSDVLNAVSNYKERNWFFRFLEFGGMGGLIALILVIVFSLLLVVLALKSNSNPNIVEVVKLSFTTILGFFFGSQSQARGKK